MSGAARSGGVWIDAALLCAIKAAIGAWVLCAGFSHVSDDDYSRTVIAEQFALAPRLDPSGTSWLPFPFWMTGSAMILAGRSLAVARITAIAAGLASVVAPYAAMRAVLVARAPAFAAVVVAMALPWNAWLGVATVPEGWAGALAAAGTIAMGLPSARVWCAAALLAASLSRYEVWPACVLFAGLSCARALRRGDRAGGALAAAALAIAGPVAWMGWNAAVHGSALHFVARVSAFRRAAIGGELPFAERILGYPRALAVQTPEIALLAVLGAAGISSSEALRTRWRWSAIAALVVIAFLVAGDVRDGAPTHHPERALTLVWWVSAGAGIDAIACALRAFGPRTRRAAAVATACLALAWAFSLPWRWAAAPGNTEWDKRDAQIARGLDMRARRVAAAEITPCAFEHFALVAAWGEPERAHVNPPARKPPTPDCPRVSELR